MNNILWSPPLSASGAPRSPFYPSLPDGRPRSHTAPPTPGRETSQIAELPGSLLQENEGYPTCHTPRDKTKHGSEKIPPGIANGLGIERPRTSPRESGNTFQHKRNVSENSATPNHHRKQDSEPLLLIQRNLPDDSNQYLRPVLQEGTSSKSLRISDSGSPRKLSINNRSVPLYRNDSEEKEIIRVRDIVNSDCDESDLYYFDFSLLRTTS